MFQLVEKTLFEQYLNCKYKIYSQEQESQNLIDRLLKSVSQFIHKRSKMNFLRILKKYTLKNKYILRSLTLLSYMLFYSEQFNDIILQALSLYTSNNKKLFDNQIILPYITLLSKSCLSIQCYQLMKKNTKKCSNEDIKNVDLLFYLFNHLNNLILIGLNFLDGMGYYQLDDNTTLQQFISSIALQCLYLTRTLKKLIKYFLKQNQQSINNILNNLIQNQISIVNKKLIKMCFDESLNLYNKGIGIEFFDVSRKSTIMTQYGDSENGWRNYQRQYNPEVVE